MILVKVYFNTDADGSPVDDSVQLDDMPTCAFGPFASRDDAEAWIHHDYPDGDTDVHDFAVVDVVLPDDIHINGPDLVRDEEERTWKAPMIEFKVKITNVYPDDEIVRHVTLSAPAPPADADEREEWAQELLFPLTGTGRAGGDAGYFVEIVECADDASLVGAEFEWGT